VSSGLDAEQERTRLLVDTDVQGTTAYEFTVRRTDTVECTLVRGILLHLQWSIGLYSISGKELILGPNDEAKHLASRHSQWAVQRSRLSNPWDDAAPDAKMPDGTFAVLGQATYQSDGGWYVIRCTADDAVCLQIDQDPLFGDNRRASFGYRELSNHHVYKYLENGEHKFEAVYFDKQRPAKLDVEIRPIETGIP
jgi:hypothetical protein